MELKELYQLKKRVLAGENILQAKKSKNLTFLERFPIAKKQPKQGKRKLILLQSVILSGDNLEDENMLISFAKAVKLLTSNKPLQEIKALINKTETEFLLCEKKLYQLMFGEWQTIIEIIEK